MKFETKFGIGEIVYIMAANSHNNNIPDLLGQIVSLVIGRDNVMYLVELVTSDHDVRRVHYEEWQITGDPDYDQELGRYPEEG